MFGDINLFVIFTTGLLIGGVSCLAVQGGLLASTLAQSEEERIRNKELGGNRSHLTLPITSFLLAKLSAYTLLGALLGWFGSILQISPVTNLVLQFTVVIFMIGTALNLLNVHPIFRYFVIQPPRFLTRFIWKYSKRHPHFAKASRGRDVFAPAVLGAFTVFVPCGATQAMMVLAIASGSPLAGAAVLFAFILGTTPLFFLLGYFAMRAGELFKAQFAKIAATVLIAIALFNLNGAIALTGTPYTVTNFVHNTFCFVSYCSQDMYGIPVTAQTIMITSSGYSPSKFTVPAGATVTVKLENNGGFGCQQSFTIPALGIQKIVAPNHSDTFTFSAPNKPGVISFMCSMGMYPGVIRVI